MSGPDEATAHSVKMYGAGLGYRREFSDELREHGKEIDVVEILADQWMTEAGLAQLREVAEEFRMVTHGVSMSLAGAGRIDPEYLAQVRAIVDLCDSDYYSEHLAVTHVPGFDAGHLCPPILNEENLRACIRNVKQAQSALGVPLAIENITYSVATSPDHLAGASFLADLVTATDSLILLDVTNLYINSKNHSFDAGEYLKRLPMERVVHIHLAGGVLTAAGKLVDSHSEIIGEEIWELARQTAQLCDPRTVIVEHDQDFPRFEALLDEVAAGRNIYFAER
ncbi:DUF692 domain-containing protein (plasmid) [Streptomyces sp. NBC_01527]|uniref:DUF692 domain-containing protein n=1 Tax=Streptomyces sp. NBC_01527 TaxID=2903894 RepID=UPI002F90EA99